MTLQPDQLLAFLKSIHLFRGLSDDGIAEVAGLLKEEIFPPKKVILEEGKAADKFYLIHSGKVGMARKGEKGQESLAIFTAGDYFGEMGAALRGPRSASVTAQETTHLLFLSRQNFENLIKKYPRLKTNTEIAISSRRLNRRLNFKWIRSDEVVYFMARKHPAFLLSALVLPASLALLALFVALIPLPAETKRYAFLGSGGLLTLAAAWGIWRWLDWSNDYYIVTNQRIVWLEKVIAIYDSRVEAPLSAIRYERVETDQLGRILDYGNVVVYTIVGRIVFGRVSHPNEAAALVAEHRERARIAARQVEQAAIRDTINQRLFRKDELPAEAEKPKIPDASAIQEPKRSFGERIFGDLFTLRFEVKDTITYRKHWFVLAAQTWKPFLFLLALILVRKFWPSLIAASQNLFNLIWISILIGALVWWVYQFIDWRNDIFRVTPDQILDIDKTPLGRETRKSSPLENILSIEYRRIGILELLFNYGTVYITVGPEVDIAFEDVLDPAGVQQDIDRRRLASNARKEEAKAKAERERLANWFAAYHESVAERKPPLGKG
ncbi:MAG: cyclic nucleotide-binding domain-containing protein [Anaerolineales bacterium]|nr:cyclic nucleotide-binding domain-containing protein [Anaerolineales bacterium]